MVSLIVILAVVLILLILVFWAVGAYNSMVKMKNKAEEAESDLEAYMKKRFDLVPNLVETVKGYAKHESATFENVTKARNMGLSSNNIEDMDKANNMLTGALKTLFAVSESYPELKANTGFLNLQSELSSLEEQILKSRKYYNGVARTFNDKILTFPSNLIASAFHFTKLSYVEINAESKETPQVKF